MTATLTRKFAAALLGVSIVAGALGTVSRAEAASLTPAEAAAIAGLGGFIVGNMVGHAQHRHQVVVVEEDWGLHVARCEARYMTYDESSDTYVGYDGYRHRCRL